MFSRKETYSGKSQKPLVLGRISGENEAGETVTFRRGGMGSTVTRACYATGETYDNAGRRATLTVPWADGRKLYFPTPRIG
jgi:hypothetical protein